MEIRAVPTALDGVVIIETAFVHDERGFFIETYHRENYAAQGLIGEFVQDNHSRSAKGVLRGIHYQDMTAPMIKLVRCTAGALLDVAVDLRVGSPTFGRSVMVELSAENKKQLWVPVGFGHAFLALVEGTEIQYKCSNYYAPATEGAIAWNDPDLAIPWPIADPLLSTRDRAAMSLKDYLANPAFRAP
jgi:dTDP-4-dehydrorhamnose 3,5-epimerase